MATPVKWGKEFIVNTTTLSNQDFPSMTTLADGSFVVTWQDHSADAGDIRAQIFAADGSKLGGEILVNTLTTNAQFQANAVALAGGGFVVAWTDGGVFPRTVGAQVFTSTGVKVGFQKALPTDVDGFKEQVEFLPSGSGFIGFWYANDVNPAPLEELRGGFFNANADPISGEFPVNSILTNTQNEPNAAYLSNGNIVVTYRDGSGTAGDTDDAIRGRIFTPTGSPIAGEFLVNTTTAGGQEDAYVVGLTGGGFVAAWRDFSSDLGDVRARIFDNDGNETVAEFVVNTVTAGIQADPAIAALPDGRFVIAYFAGDPGNAEIKAQVFFANGQRDGADFIVQSDLIHSQSEPSITVLPDGRFVISWQDFSDALGGDNDGSIHAQIFDPRTAGISKSGTAGADILAGTPFADNLKGGAGVDKLFGEGGNDKLDGGTGADKMSGGAGNDTYIVDNTGDVLTETSGTDTVQASVSRTLASGFEKLILTGSKNINGTGSSGANTITGNSHANKLDGKAGNDILLGGAGKDTLIGGAGKDEITGGAGRTR